MAPVSIPLNSKSAAKDIKRESGTARLLGSGKETPRSPLVSKQLTLVRVRWCCRAVNLSSSRHNSEALDEQSGKGMALERERTENS